MKRIAGLTGLVLFLLISVSLMAEESSMFVKTIPISRIYSHRLGFRVVYPAGDLKVSEVFLPTEWFSNAGSMGEIVWGTHPSYPYMSIFWQDGKFHHVRLYLQRNMNSPGWGKLDESVDWSDQFSVETLILQ